MEDSRPTILLSRQTKHLPRLLHSHGHTGQCFLLITLPNYSTKKLQSGKAASYESVKKNEIMCTITEISQEINLSSTTPPCPFHMNKKHQLPFQKAPANWFNYPALVLSKQVYLAGGAWTKKWQQETAHVVLVQTCISRTRRRTAMHRRRLFDFFSFHIWLGSTWKVSFHLYWLVIIETFSFLLTHAHTHIPKWEKQPWSYSEKSLSSQPITVFLTGISLSKRNKSVKWNIAEEICDSLLNDPFKHTPCPFESSNKFWPWQQFSCFQPK